MAYTKLVMENPYNGQIKKAPVGISWTVLFFAFFTSFSRGLEMGNHHLPAHRDYPGFKRDIVYVYLQQAVHKRSDRR